VGVIALLSSLAAQIVRWCTRRGSPR